MEEIILLKNNERFAVDVIPGEYFQTIVLGDVKRSLISSKVYGSLNEQEMANVKHTLSDRQTFMLEDKRYMVVVLAELIGKKYENPVRFVKF